METAEVAVSAALFSVPSNHAVLKAGSDGVVFESTHLDARLAYGHDDAAAIAPVSRRGVSFVVQGSGGGRMCGRRRHF